jgi:DNA mismatch repair ATPase MutS
MGFQKEEYYNNNITTTAVQIKQLNGKINRFSFLRLALILGGGFALFQVIQSEQIALTLITFIAILLLFFWLVFIQSKLVKSKEALERFLKVNENEIAVYSNRSSNIYSNGETYVDDRHLYSSDLDIYGDSSLFQLVNRCASIGGIQKLAGWLNRPAEKEHIEVRQEFVGELSDSFDFWQNIQAQLIFILGNPTDYKRKLEAYLSKTIPISQSKFLRSYIKIAPFLMLALLAGSFFSSKLLALFIIVGILHLLLSIFFAGKVNQIVADVNKAGSSLLSFSSVFEAIEQRSWKSQLAKTLLSNIETKTNNPVSQSIKNLSKICERLDVRLNAFVGTILNVFLLWDLKQVFALEEWRKTQSLGISEAFDMLSEFEAIGSMATLHFNRPNWTFPRINYEKTHVLETSKIAHPFISDQEVIANDYSLSDHQLALITGSNMAGKSTFLRTVGINAVLAYAGAPVNASSMEISVMQMATYMRIRDSINESTSTFKAELNRIKQILEEVEINPNTFFLLDEMLRGTNSVDKYLGSKAIIEKLIANKGVGMVATHDLKLADLSQVYPDYVRNFHFDIQVKGEDMLFDYLLKDGACTIFNASLLLKKIGIHI